MTLRKKMKCSKYMSCFHKQWRYRVPNGSYTVYSRNWSDDTPYTQETQVWSQTISCGICGGMRSRGTGFCFEYFGTPLLVLVPFHQCSVIPFIHQSTTRNYPHGTVKLPPSRLPIHITHTPRCTASHSVHCTHCTRCVCSRTVQTRTCIRIPLGGQMSARVCLCCLVLCVGTRPRARGT
jgi:hypothetical protein